MSDRPSTLFPCTSSIPSQEPLQVSSWLHNSSFPQHLVESANSVTREKAVQEKKTSSVLVKKESKRRKTEKSSSDKKKKKKHKKNRSDKTDEKLTKFDIFELLYKGDKDNYRYGSLYSYDVPTYKPYVKCCLGDNAPLFRGPHSKSKSSSAFTHDSSLRYYKKLGPPELTLQYRTRFLRIDADYISLTVSSQCWEPAEPVLAVLDPSKTEPRSAERWIQFITSTGRTKAGLERRYEICQKARKFLPNNLDILKKTIDTAKQFMSNQQIGRVWTDLLFHHPNKVELWLEYLSYKETNLTELNFSSVVAAYKKCLTTLFGFHQGTFRSHTFEGDIEYALTAIAARFIKLLYNMGYSEKAMAYNVSLLELSTSTRDKGDYLKWWDSDSKLLGSNGYLDWWVSHLPSTAAEVVTQLTEVEDPWFSWLQEERRKEGLSAGPTCRRLTEDVIDPECCVSSAWLQQFLFTTSKPEQLFESLFRTYLPDNVATLPLVALFHCHITLPHRIIEFLTNVCEQLYSRFTNQTIVGVVWTLLTHLKSKNAKSTARFVKGLLKEPSHRNNMVYWSLYAHFSTEGRGVLHKLLSTPLSTYHSVVLRNRLVTCQGTDSSHGTGSDVDSVDREIEVLICKPIASMVETLHLGSHMTSLFCSNYKDRLHSTAPPSDSYLVNFLSKLLSCEMSRDQLHADMCVLFRHVIQCEKSGGGGEGHNTRLKKITLLGVEQFPQIPMFWDILKEHITLTNKMWDRLLKSDQETVWWRRIQHECHKQDCHPDINLRNRIVSLSVSAIESFPRSRLLWDLYISVTKKYDTKSLKSILIRSIKENPAIKEFYLQAIEFCPEEDGTVYELIEEKQIRLRTLVEEIQMFCDKL